MNVYNCPCCLSSEFEVVLSINNDNIKNFKSLDNKYYNNSLILMMNINDIKVGRCKICLHHWYLKQPSEEKIKSMYEKKYLPEKKHTYKIKRESIIKQILIMRKITKGNSFLDFGSGSKNHWEQVATKFKFDYYGYDPFIKKKISY